jgi:hypothetical protein
VRRGREAGHVGADLGQDHLRGDRPDPGIASSRATAGASSPIWASMRACTVAMSAVIASTRCSIWVSRKAWWSVNRPVSASVSGRSWSAACRGPGRPAPPDRARRRSARP